MSPFTCQWATCERGGGPVPTNQLMCDPWRLVGTRAPVDDIASTCFGETVEAVLDEYLLLELGHPDLSRPTLTPVPEDDVPVPLSPCIVRMDREFALRQFARMANGILTPAAASCQLHVI